MKKLGFFLCLALMLGIASGSALAQNVGDSSVFFVTYFANNVAAAAVPDGTVRVVNDGENGDLYAAYYVFDDSQELTECGACYVSADGVNSESIKRNLTANPLTRLVPTRGVIKLISSSSPDATKPSPTAGLRAWATHIQSVKNINPYGAAPWAQTETMFADSNLSSTEQTLLGNLCYYAKILGSGTGTISCTPEDYDF